MKRSGDTIILSSGKILMANCGVIGLDAYGQVFSGYDDNIDTEDLTPQERIELADYMISEWEAFK